MGRIQTPAQRAASIRNLELAREARKLKARAAPLRRNAAHQPHAPRGTGRKGLQANFVPYARVNKRSQTIGANAGTKIPGTKRRIVVGGYARLEKTTHKTAFDKVTKKIGNGVFPAHTKHGKYARVVKNNVSINAPLVRASVKGHQVRLGTSRGAGPTVIVRRGKHKTPAIKSAAGINKYNNQMSKIAGRKAAKSKSPRPQRRNAAKKRATNNAV